MLISKKNIKGLMKKSFLVSLIIHGLVVFAFLFKSNTPDPKKKEEPQLASSSYEIEIIEINDFGTQDTEDKKKNFYWGIGINQDFNNLLNINGVDTYGVMVLKVVPGYTGERDGILVGDFVIAVNGKAWSIANDIKGEGPLKLVLTVYRNGVIIDIETARCKVYF